MLQCIVYTSGIGKSVLMGSSGFFFFHLSWDLSIHLYLFIYLFWGLGVGVNRGCPCAPPFFPENLSFLDFEC